MKRGAAAAQAAIRPREKDTNPRFQRERREPRQAADGEETVQARIPKIKKLEELREITRARIEIQRISNRSRNAQFGSGGPAIGSRGEGVANGLQRVLLARGEFHCVNVSLAKRNIRDRARTKGKCGEGKGASVVVFLLFLFLLFLFFVLLAANFGESFLKRGFAEEIFGESGVVLARCEEDLTDAAAVAVAGNL